MKYYTSLGYFKKAFKNWI